MTKPLFLKWILINVFTLIAGGVAALVFLDRVGNVSITTRVLAGVILLVYFVMDGYVGSLMWKMDWVLGPSGPQAEDGLWKKKVIKTVVHDSEHVYFTMSLLQILGLVGTVTGFLVAMVGGFGHLNSTGNVAIQGLIQHIAIGSATALLCTLVGIVTSVVLGIMHHLLLDTIERDASGIR